MTGFAVVGTDVPRIDGPQKVTGQTIFATDVFLPAMLWGQVLRSSQAHAELASVDISRALRQPGVRAILTGADLGDVLTGMLLKDRPLLCFDRVRFVGDPIAAVAAETPEAAQQALRLIEVEYRPRDAVFDPERAMTVTAPVLHPAARSYAGRPDLPQVPNLQGYVHITRGDVEQGFARSELVFQQTFRVPGTHQGYIEPRGCAVSIEADGTVRIWSSCQAPYTLRDMMAELLNLPARKVVVERTSVGGSFGAKDGVYFEPLAYYLARATGCGVKMVPSYTEELTASTPRHPATVTLRTGVLRDGTLVARSARIVMDGGAYAGPKVRPGLILPSSTRVLGPYRIPHTEIEGFWAYTNNTPGGTARAPGQPQVVFAGESQMDIIARELGMDPLDFRRKNAVVEGDVWPDGSLYEGVLVRESLDLLRTTSAWDTPLGPHHGRGMAMTERSVGAGLTGLRVTLEADGTITAVSAVPDVGTGAFTVLKQMLAEEMHLPLDALRIVTGNTNQTPRDSGIGGSRHTYSLMVAVVETTAALKKRLAETAARRLECSAEDLELADHSYRVRGYPTSRVAVRDVIAGAVASSDGPIQAESAGPPRGSKAPQSCIVAYAAEVQVDPETGEVTLTRLVGVHDVGRAVNPQLLQAQIDGATIQGVGLALMEDLAREEGRVGASHLGDYKMPGPADIPELVTVLVEGAPAPLPYELKSVGELSHVTIGAAVANAVACASGARVYALPVTSERVWGALSEASRAGH